jgi:hypothetical protein
MHYTADMPAAIAARRKAIELYESLLVSSNN